MFSCEVCGIFKNTYFEEHLRTTSSGNLDIQSEMYGRLLIPVLLSKLSSELSSVTNQPFDRKDCWGNRLVLKYFKSEIIARKKTHYTSNNLNEKSDLPLPA